MALPTKILVPTDFSADSTAALDYAVELAAKIGAAVHLAHFYAFPLTPFGAAYAFASAELNKSIESDASKALAKLIEEHGRPGVELSASARLGDARSGIQEAAAEVGADLVCMGTHGRRGVMHVLMGSVAEYTARVSKIPTLIVRAP